MKNRKLRRLGKALYSIPIYFLTVFYFNCCAPYQPEPVFEAASVPPASAITSEAKLAITTWNLGYAGLGKESDFKMDGGEHILPPSRETVIKNATTSAQSAKDLDSDIFFFQEFARPSFVNRNVDAARFMKERLSDYDSIYLPDFKTRLIPWPLGIEVGLAVFFRKGRYLSSEAFLLEQEPRRFGLRKTYQALVVRLEIDGEKWAFINTHLAAFDNNGAIRSKQARQVLQIAQSEETKGSRVVVGGDWNLLLSKPTSSHTTKTEHLFWLRNSEQEWLEFPQESLPKGWSLRADKTIPTVRTLERPYVKNENFVGQIDGFVTLPATKVARVFGTQFNFESSDHNPVTIWIRK